MLRNKLKVGIDVDDVLYTCVPYVCELINRDYPYDYPIKEAHFTDWGYAKHPYYQKMFDYFKTEEFTYNQPIIKGAKEFIEKMKEIAEIFIITAVHYESLTARAKRLIEDFDIDPSHIILGSRKDLVELDVMLDDAAHNILESKAKFPILFRRPWNEYLTGVLSVHSYDEVLEIIKTIENTHDPKGKPKLLCLVGPSGSNKSDIIKEFKNEGLVDTILSTTTRALRDGESQNDPYEFISNEEYEKLLNDGEFLERSVYAKNHYGIRKSRIEKFMNSNNKLGLISLDICGAIKLKSLYKDKVNTIFIKNNKKVLLEEILKKKTDISDHVNRILAIDAENKNRLLCDYMVNSKEELKDLILKIQNK